MFKMYVSKIQEVPHDSTDSNLPPTANNVMSTKNKKAMRMAYYAERVEPTSAVGSVESQLCLDVNTSREFVSLAVNISGHQRLGVEFLDSARLLQE